MYHVHGRRCHVLPHDRRSGFAARNRRPLDHATVAIHPVVPRSVLAGRHRGPRAPEGRAKMGVDVRHCPEHGFPLSDCAHAYCAAPVCSCTALRQRLH